MNHTRLGLRSLIAFVAVAAASLLVAGCSTAPKANEMSSFITDAEAARLWFVNNVPGLREQIDKSAGYIVYPSVGQWGILFMGGQFGRGTLNRPDGSQIGWAALNTSSVGLQAGVRGFKMLVVIQDKPTLDKFMANQLSGSVSGVVVVAEDGASSVASFSNGVAVYEGASSGLMAGVNIALDYMRYQPLESP